MDHLIWGKKFETNVPMIDQQHQKLFQIINNLVDVINSGVSNRDVIFSILSQMSDYSQYHFRFENNLIQQEDYIGRTRHLNEHGLYLKKLCNFIDDFSNEKTDLTSAILNFLVDWWSNHIIGIDQELAEHVIKHHLSFSGFDQ